MKPSSVAVVVGIIAGVVAGIASGAIGLGAIFGEWLPWILGLAAGTTAYAEYLKVRAHSNLADRR